MLGAPYLARFSRDVGYHEPRRFSRKKNQAVRHSRGSRKIQQQWLTKKILPAQAKPVSLVGEADGEQQHTQREETKHAVTLTLLADPVQEHLCDA
jgi:hypothetical protein